MKLSSIFELRGTLPKKCLTTTKNYGKNVTTDQYAVNEQITNTA